MDGEDRRGRLELIKTAVAFAKIFLGKGTVLSDSKSGAIYTPSQGLELSKAIEVIEHKGFSLDVGVTKSQGFVGISKDIFKTNSVKLDVGGGIATRRDPFVGAHVKITL